MKSGKRPVGRCHHCGDDVSMANPGGSFITHLDRSGEQICSGWGETATNQMIIAYQFGGTGTLVPRKHFAHEACVPKVATNHKNMAINYNRYLVVVPSIDLTDARCFICDNPML